MTTQETISYLKACFDAEEGVADCAMMVNQLTTQIKSLEGKRYDRLVWGQMPKEPEYIDYVGIKKGLEDTLQRAKNHKSYLGKALLFGDISWARIEASIKKNEKETAQVLERKLAEYDKVDVPKYIAENEKRRNQYELALTEFRMKSAAYRENCRLVDQETIATLSKSLEEYQQTMEDYAQMREQLYAMDILYPDFRNPIAEDYLIRYLEMGICTELTGPNGAYRIYLDDIRTNKIVQSIRDLQNTVYWVGEILVRAIKASTAVLSQQVQAMNVSLNELNSNLQTGLAQVNENFLQVQMQFATYTSDMASSQKKILDQVKAGQDRLYNTISKSAYNQYIEQRKNNLHNYLYQQLRDPIA